jgi:hypothetical protein
MSKEMINQCSHCNDDLIDFSYTKEECKQIHKSLKKGIYYKIGLPCHECLKKLKVMWDL